MRLIETYRGYKDSEFGIGRFYRSDIRKLNALRLYYDFPSNSKEIFNRALDEQYTLFAVLKKGRHVVGYLMYEFPYLGRDNLWLFRIPQRITEEDFGGVQDIVAHYCNNILNAECPYDIHLFVKTREEKLHDKI